MAMGSPGDPPRQVEQEAQRGGVGRVGVVHGEHQRPRGGQVHGEPVDAVHQRGRVAGVGGRAGAGLEEGKRGGRRAGEQARRARPPPRTGPGTRRAEGPRPARASARGRGRSPPAAAVPAPGPPRTPRSSTADLPDPWGPSTATTAPRPADEPVEGGRDERDHRLALEKRAVGGRCLVRPFGLGSRFQVTASRGAAGHSAGLYPDGRSRPASSLKPLRLSASGGRA